MSEIHEFRVWDRKENEYLDNFFVYINGNGKLFIESGSSLVELSSDRFIIEKCTGLKDKNRNLIFEGDILKLIPHNKNVFVYLFSSEYMVKTNNDSNEYGAYATLKSTKIYKNSWEIVGNIYETPELLEV